MILPDLLRTVLIGEDRRDLKGVERLPGVAPGPGRQLVGECVGYRELHLTEPAFGVGQSASH